MYGDVECVVVEGFEFFVDEECVEMDVVGMGCYYFGEVEC